MDERMRDWLEVSRLGVNAYATSGSPGAQHSVESIPAMRMVIDFADLSSSVGIHSTGQSGHPLSSDCDSMNSSRLACNADEASRYG